MSELKLAGVLEKDVKQLDEVDVDYLVYRSYKYQRDHFPDRTPDQWALCFDRTNELEKRYQKEKTEGIVPSVRMYKGRSLDNQNLN